MGAARVEEGEGAKDVRLVVDAGDLDRGAYAGTGGEVDDGVEPAGRLLRLEDAGDSLDVGDVGLLEAEARAAQEAREAPLLEADVVGVVEVVDADDGIAPAEEPLADGGADEPGPAGDQDAHYSPKLTPAKSRKLFHFQLSPSTAPMSWKLAL